MINFTVDKLWYWTFLLEHFIFLLFLFSDFWDLCLYAFDYLGWVYVYLSDTTDIRIIFLFRYLFHGDYDIRVVVGNFLALFKFLPSICNWWNHSTWFQINWLLDPWSLGKYFLYSLPKIKSIRVCARLVLEICEQIIRVLVIFESPRFWSMHYWWWSCQSSWEKKIMSIC